MKSDVSLPIANGKEKQWRKDKKFSAASSAESLWGNVNGETERIGYSGKVSSLLLALGDTCLNPLLTFIIIKMPIANCETFSNYQWCHWIQYVLYHHGLVGGWLMMTLTTSYNNGNNSRSSCEIRNDRSVGIFLVSSRSADFIKGRKKEGIMPACFLLSFLLFEQCF